MFRPAGGVPTPWSAEETPYMVEPMTMLASRRHEAVCFVGPARTGKTGGLLLGWMAHAVVNDPGDMLFIQMTQDKAREFSKTDIDRAIRNSPKIAELMGSRQEDNTHDKMFKHGMWLRIAWPTVSNVSGSTYRYVAITDIDRMANAENVDGEGPLFKLALKRTQTFLSRGMTLVESSPGIEITDPHWTPATRHEAPNVAGILGIYNQSDRRRFYWRCLDCSEHFQAEPGLKLFGLPDDDTLLEIIREVDIEQMATEYNRVICPHCGSIIGPRTKKLLNANGRWLQDGLLLDRDGQIIGTPMESSIAGYWLGGVAAAYQPWRSLVLRHLQGLRSYALTGLEETLKATTNTDQGAPYMPRILREAARASTDPASRKDKSLERYVMPEWARVLLASVDIQGGINPRFVVQVHAVGEGRRRAIIDRFNITESNREGVDGGKAPIDPARHAEDWDQITELVLRKTYRTHIENLEMRVKMVAVDTGGEDGVTERAYAWYRRCVRQGIAGRIMLVKGVGAKAKQNVPLLRHTLVGNVQAKEKGDVPLYLLNSNVLKDVVHHDLMRSLIGPGYVHIPHWLPNSVLDELTSEVRNEDGTWTQVRARNEAFDLLCYCEALIKRLSLDRIDWRGTLPTWLQPVQTNSERITRSERREMQENERIATVELPARLEPSPVKTRGPRRIARSSYLS